MKKILLTAALLLLPTVLFAQYYGERSAEQSFERSDIYFNSHYLNTFGLHNFKEVSVGLINDTFLNFYLNPANSPKPGKDNALIYLDFRGDRTSFSVVESYVAPDYYAPNIIYRMPIPDPRWYSVTRSEPEPIFSFGILTNPIKDITENFYIGGTYQFIHREEKFYEVPYWIYRPLYYYDSFGVRAEGLADIPIKDRYSSKDEMITDGHLYSLFAGYRLSENLSVGLSLNGVSHDRTGGYLNSRSDEYNTTNNDTWENIEEQNRNHDYHHTDISAGISYAFSEKFTAGIKAGYLNGNAEQDYISTNNYISQRNTPNVSGTWNYSLSNSSTQQTWEHKGINRYFGFNFSYKPEEGRTIIGYYRYTHGKENLLSLSAVNDTSFYTSRYVSTNYESNYNGRSSTHDIRNGSGSRINNTHEALVSFTWELTPSSTVIIGGYWKNSESDIINNEPVNADRFSEYHGDYKNNDNNYSYDSFTNLIENKRLEWEYSSEYWSIQIPVLLQFDLNESFGIMLGINRIIKGWQIKDRTTAYFSLRERIDNGEIKRETNFGERYTQPTKGVMENETKFIARFNVSVSPAFKINLLVDPEFEKNFRVAQWWLSFEARI